jgi:hypothetical protein
VTARPIWEFDYSPISNGGGDDGSPERDLVIATRDDIDPGKVAELLAAAVRDVSVTPLFSAHPVFWTRVTSSEHMDRTKLAQALRDSGSEVRYITSARRGSQRLAPRLETDAALPRRAHHWISRGPTNRSEPNTRWRWFLRPDGVDVIRSVCGTGAGTRLAVIDNDGREIDRIDLDAAILVNCAGVPRAGAHAGLMLGWAVGALSDDGRHFRGVAPDASPRLYCIPKAADEIFSLPLAIVNAVEDGADVILCTTYVEGLTSPLLDDALEFATRLGRGGRGSAVVMPTGREMSSPSDSVHCSLSLGLAEPASDPRVFCVGPSARDGGWFLWRDRRGKLRPFANRGPALRWLAPGDDLAYPFTSEDKPAHAESSGSAAVAAGVLLLVLGKNPTLDLEELDQLLLDTVVEIDPAQRATEPELGDRADLLPFGRDPDGHNAKHGYGRLSALAACLAASDPVCGAWVRIGEIEIARHYAETAVDTALRPYSDALGRWAARAMIHDATARHAACSVARAMRLLAWSPSRGRNPHGTFLRHFGILIRLLMRSPVPPELVAELREIDERIRATLADNALVTHAEGKLLEFFRRFEATSEDELPVVSDRHLSSHA